MLIVCPRMGLLKMDFEENDNLDWTQYVPCIEDNRLVSVMALYTRVIVASMRALSN